LNFERVADRPTGNAFELIFRDVLGMPFRDADDRELKSTWKLF
jgi:hypothetical protein